MSWLPDALQARISALVQPTAGDILRAKRSILGRLEESNGERVDELQWVLVDEAGLPRTPDRNDVIGVETTADIEAVVRSDDALIERVRLQEAALTALAELADAHVPWTASPTPRAPRR